MGRSRRAVHVEEDALSRNHYTVMEIHDFAPTSDAKRAYHRLALLWHPDRQLHASKDLRKEAEDRFKRINEAYAVLSDEGRRKQYDIILRGELLGVAPGRGNQAGDSRSSKEATADPKATSSSNRTRGERNTAQGPGGVSGGVRLIMCPECGIGAEAKAGKKGGPSLQCRGCGGYFHEVYCAGCQDWGATRGRRGESTMRCGCGNVFCQSRCPTCCRWNTFNGEAQGGRTRSCGFCGDRFHEAFCPGCSGWGVWEGAKGCRSLSCDCGGLFYEISCQSCGMWGSVKGRHADADNSLRCGTCGCESHEAFCPSCGQWECFLGAKGESTLCCRSSRCRGRKGPGGGVKFFQVYCQSCTSWRSVMGEKDAVGNASIRCQGCMSTFQGVICPACGNWDQKHHRTMTSPNAGTAEGQGEGSNECGSCGHRPLDGEDNPPGTPTSRSAENAVSAANRSAMRGTAVEESEGNEDGAATGAVLCAVGTEGGQPRRVAPPLQEGLTEANTPITYFRGKKKSGGPRTSDDGLRDRSRPLKDDLFTDLPVGVAPTHGGAEPRTENSQSLVKETDHQLRGHVPELTDVVGRGDGAGSGADCADDTFRIPPATLTRERAPRAPPARSRARRGGRRPSIPRRASRATVAAISTAGETPKVPTPAKAEPEATVTSSREGAAGTAPHCEPQSERVNAARVKAAEPPIFSEVPVEAAASATASACSTSSVNGNVDDTGGGGGDGEPVEPPASDTEVESMPRSGRPRRKSGNKVDGFRRRRRASLSSADGTRPAKVLGPGETSRRETATTDVNFATAAAALAAVPREDSPPPPPGVRVGHTAGGRGTETGDKKGGEEHVGIADGGGHAGDGRKGSRRGRPEVIHLAFCSRCQEYQSWRAPVSDVRGRRDSARRSCGQCGNAFCNVSYYPTR